MKVPPTLRVLGNVKFSLKNEEYYYDDNVVSPLSNWSTSSSCQLNLHLSSSSGSSSSSITSSGLLSSPV